MKEVRETHWFHSCVVYGETEPMGEDIKRLLAYPKRETARKEEGGGA